MKQLLICFLVIIFSCCSKLSTPPSDGEKADTVTAEVKYAELRSDSIVETQTESDHKYSLKELNKLMDYLNGKIDKSPVKHNVQAWAVDELEKRIEVQLIVCNAEKIAEFMKQVSNSPAIIFSEVISHRPSGELCGSCGFVMVASPNVYKLPVEKINVKITNNTEAEGLTGEYFYMEYYNGNDWEKVPLNSFFNSIGYPIEASQTRNLIVNIQPDTYQYKSGKYRIFKTISVNKKDYSLIAEFRLD